MTAYVDREVLVSEGARVWTVRCGHGEGRVLPYTVRVWRLAVQNQFRGVTPKGRSTPILRFPDGNWFVVRQDGYTHHHTLREARAEISPGATRLPSSDGVETWVG